MLLQKIKTCCKEWSSFTENGSWSILVAENGKVKKIAADLDAKEIKRSRNIISKVLKTEICNVIITNIENQMSLSLCNGKLFVLSYNCVKPISWLLVDMISLPTFWCRVDSGKYYFLSYGAYFLPHIYHSNAFYIFASNHQQALGWINDILDLCYILLNCYEIDFTWSNVLH